MKKLLALAACVAIVLASSCGFADTETVDGIEWTYMIGDGKASVGSVWYFSPAIPTSTSGAITIPSSLGGYPVTSIMNFAFDSCCGLTSVTIPNSVTSIGRDAFYGCSGLTSVTFSGDAPRVGKCAFDGVGDGCVVNIPRWCKDTYEVVDGKWQGMIVVYYGCIVAGRRFSPRYT